VGHENGKALDAVLVGKVEHGNALDARGGGADAEVGPGNAAVARQVDGVLGRGDQNERVRGMDLKVLEFLNFPYERLDSARVYLDDLDWKPAVPLRKACRVRPRHYA